MSVVILPLATKTLASREDIDVNELLDLVLMVDAQASQAQITWCMR